VGIFLGCHFAYSLLRNAMTLTTFRAVRQEWVRIIWIKFYFLNLFCPIHISSIESSSISRLSLVLCSDSSIRITCSQSLTYLLTPWSRVPPEMLPGSVARQEIPAFSEPEGSSPYPQALATCPYPEPTPSSHHNSLPLPEDPS
jgi:hypothetical protein